MVTAAPSLKTPPPADVAVSFEIVSSFDAAPAGANLVTSSVAVLVQP